MWWELENVYISQTGTIIQQVGWSFTTQNYKAEIKKTKKVKSQKTRTKCKGSRKDERNKYGKENTGVVCTGMGGKLNGAHKIRNTGYRKQPDRGRHGDRGSGRLTSRWYGARLGVAQGVIGITYDRSFTNCPTQVKDILTTKVYSLLS